MKKFIYALITFISIVSTSLYSQSGWQWVNPYPTGQTIYSMSFINANTGMAVTTYGGTILLTTNGGINWASFNPYMNFVYFGCLMIDENTGFAGEINEYAPTHIVRTTNKGLTWEIVFDPGIIIQFENFTKNGNNIFACGSNYIIKSSDRGTSWTINMLDVPSLSLRSIKFLNENTGYICGVPNIIVKTTNGGINWNSIFQDTIDYNFWSIMFKDENTGFISSSEICSFRTTNGGTNWIRYPSQLGAGDFYGNYIVLNDYYSTDFGLNWIPSTTEGYYKKFADSITCFSFYTNYQKTLWKSTNKGVNWNNISKNSFDKCNDLKICSKNLFYLMTPNKIYKSYDSGENFLLKFNNAQYNLNALDFIDSLKGVAVGSSGRVLTTTNGGNNWTASTIGNNNLIGVSVYNNKIIIEDSASTAIFISTNFGINWNTVNISSARGRLMRFINTNLGFITNYGNKLFKTTNGGFNWVFVSNLSVASFDFSDENNGIGVTFNKYYRTTNGGILWDTTYFPSNLDIIYIKFAGINTVYISGMSGRILKSTNAGVNWVQQNSYSYIGIQNYELSFLDSLYGFAFTENNLLRTFSGGDVNVSISEIKTDIPKKYLLHQNYPNPFNNSSQFKFDIIKSGFVKIVLYNILGQEVQTLVNERLQPGIYEATFNGSMLNSGVYFYKLITDGFTETKRMVLIK